MTEGGRDPKDKNISKEGVHQAEILTAEESEDEPITDVSWIPVAGDLDLVQAQLLKDGLEAAGIPVVVTGSSVDSFNLYPSVENAVLVPRRWSKEAEVITKDFLDRINAEPPPFACSNCGTRVPENASVCPECGEPFDGS